MKTRVPTVPYAVLICLLSIISSPIFSQSLGFANGKIEVGLNLGPSFFLGDLGGNQGKGKTFVKDVNLPVTKLMKGLYVNFYPTEWLGFRLAANMGELEAYDSLTSSDDKNAYERKKRNLGFKSPLREAYAAVEIYPTVFFEQYDGLQFKLRPYGLAGFGMFHFNPKAQYINPDGSKTWVDLQPLHLEGQGFPEYPTRKEYSLNQYAIIMGGGLKYYLTDNMYIGFEILHRKTFTDYLDDVSTKYIDPHYFDVHLTPQQAVIARQLAYREKFLNPSVNRPYIGYQRGDPKQNDAFFSGLIRFGWRLNGANSPNKMIKRQLKCPVFY
jgi:opacity protein-like surface antigen